MAPKSRMLALAALTLLPTYPAHAAAGLPAPVMMNSGDAAWVMAAAILGLIAVVAGLGLRFAGLVRAKNFVSIFAHIFGVAAVVSLLWIGIGYSLAFGEGNSVIGGLSLAMMGGLGAVFPGSTVPESGFAFFHMVFAIFAAVLLVGAWAERARFGWAIAVAFLWTLVIYAPVAHWMWGQGWLSNLGAFDFAGGLVVHLSAGVSALVLTLLVGKRAGLAEGPIAPHGPAIALGGTAILWAGWFALVGGAGATADFNAGAAMLNVQASASMAALVWAFADKLSSGHSSATGIATGALTGLVAISAAANVVGPAGAMVIGFGAAVAGRIAMSLARNLFKADDPLGIFAIHGAAGATGALLLAVLMAPLAGGVGYPEGGSMIAQLIAQVVAVAAIALWSAFATAAIAWLAGIVFPMRASEEAEQAGLDLSDHGERAWNG
ncbi:ammonium transporter [uncultured Parasphingopyxis sp.]|uniref:ammonium transporter n=1 Tax=uncultured Parasphingopyxis sp. TaxID=1547918 RepID=UPI002627E151|nr:ammonium transporter [uncultured Parasphingopyxis sp.]